MSWNTGLKEQTRLYHFQLPCWFAWADPPESFTDKLEEVLLKDIQVNGFDRFRQVSYKDLNQLELFDDK